VRIFDIVEDAPIPQPVRIGRSLYWRTEELKAWVAAGCPDRGTWIAMQA